MSSTPLGNAYAVRVEQVIETLATSARTGLTQREAHTRALAVGRNVLPQERQRTNAWRIFWGQWKSPLLYILLAAGALSAGFGHYLDAFVIIGTGLINALVGFFQEYKADTALAALAEYAPEYAAVRRDGKQHAVLTTELVPGDIILLREGDRVPADARVIEAYDFFVAEAILTGESLPVEKHPRAVSKRASTAARSSMVFAGTGVTRGRAEAIITGIGADTEIGRIATMVATAPETATPLQQEIQHLGRIIMVLAAVASALVLVIGLFQGRPIIEMVLVAVAVAIAAIPEGLVITLTVVLTVGMQRILARQALVRRLIAAETLGSVSVMCVDKTGTITLGRMDVTDVVTADEIETGKRAAASYQKLLQAMVLCTDAELIRDLVSQDFAYRGEATEVALLMAGVREHIYKDTLLLAHPRIGTIAFDAQRKYMATLHRGRGAHMLFVKGAPEVVLPLCGTATPAGVIQEKKMATAGLRVLAIAMAEVPKGDDTLTHGALPPLQFFGFVGLTDPVRPGVAEVIAQAAAAGVRTIMITGDHVLTAKSIAKSIGLPARESAVATGIDIDGASPQDMALLVKRVSVFARVEPRHKMQIVQALQAAGQVVAMTGDGVNDAPAMKAADIGIAVGSGTSVAKGVADMVLLDDAISTIVAAIREGRVIFENIRTVVLYFLSNMFTELILIACSLMFFLPLPLSAVQILWINVITDTLAAMALAFDPPSTHVMQEPPRPKHASILRGKMKAGIFAVSILADVLLFIFYYSIQRSTLDASTMQTMLFLAVGFSTLVYVHAIRTLEKPCTFALVWNNPWLLFAQVAGILFLIAAVAVPGLRLVLGTVPLAPIEWVMIAMLALLKLVIIEVTKRIWYRLAHKEIQPSYAH